MKRYWEDIEVGEEYVTPSRTITEADIVMFAALTWDTHPMHVDAEYARNTVYGGRIAHGLLGLAYMDGLKALCPMENELVSMGTIRWTVDFKAPIRIGDTITARFNIARKRETRKPDRGIIALQCSLLNQKGEVLQEAEHLRMIKRRPSVAAAMPEATDGTESTI
ncbi:MAG: MaoC family dehydratase [Chloroflexota bacterium]